MRSSLVYTIPVLVLFSLISILWQQQTENVVRAHGKSDDQGRNILKRYGIVGDGKTDCSAAIQRAVDASAGSLHFPRGVYRLTKTVTIELNEVGPTSLAGDGTATFIMSGPGPARVVQIALLLRQTMNASKLPAEVLGLRY